MASGSERRAQPKPNYIPSVPMLGMLSGGSLLGAQPDDNVDQPQRRHGWGGGGQVDTNDPPGFPIDPNPKLPQVGDTPPMYPTDPNSKFGQPVSMDGNGVIPGQKRPWYTAMMFGKGGAY